MLKNLMDSLKDRVRRLFCDRVFNILQLEVTSRCNCKCIMCPRVSIPQQWKHGDMSINTFKRISKYFPQSKVVYLSGWGEPLVHGKILDMVRFARKPVAPLVSPLMACSLRNIYPKSL